MGAIFANAPIQPTVAAVQVGKIYFDKRCDIRRCTASATTNIRPIDHTDGHRQTWTFAVHMLINSFSARENGIDVAMRS